MRVLLDTHILIWVLAEPHKLSQPVRSLIASRTTNVLFSTVSIWEIGIKAALLKPEFSWNPGLILAEAKAIGFVECMISSNAAIAAAGLPKHHGDPFDRLLIGQALEEPARLITADKILALYSELVDVM
ncbi:MULTISPECIES: type II toxin-antitoxin system VapC family toxin [unclassified Aureimonas]|uniref:type II toxin-antitoxin system VapC family toxin n=1 Tax=unclassified Aureimonas TaxID=2615206 RepID=UPI0006F71045|nr:MULTISPECIES: type II toxin-antitoxin system VapC family toxin [unclassified Aureimonas]KQT66140.1 hypothetical protein ASG62_20260 [Aureimonas sp. Leaf427]KQT80996.1 hypothetical protein ASG54_05990 [Aureimonas sp. Leaf460]